MARPLNQIVVGQRPQAGAGQQRTGGHQHLGIADPGQSRRHVGAGKGAPLTLLESQLGQGQLQFLTAAVHLEHVDIEAALQAAVVEVEPRQW